ncbi:MAG: CHAD domain-containing protein [Nostocaceae cyanobacterium]|nr:CHAD domain-containing protein [Nostocaceae cyanobacterium]
MTLAVQPTIKTLGDYGYEAVQKHFKKTLKWETTVKKDKDPEALHQMRVGMRRLRTAVSGFAQAIVLPKSASNKNIGKIARRLGVLRDLDVLQETLKNIYYPHVPSKEQKYLQTALDVLSKQRKDALVYVRSTLKEERYKSLKNGLKDWLEKPKYYPLASLPMQEVLPDLLFPQVSNFLLHPAWLVGTKIEDKQILIPTDWKAEDVKQQLTTNAEVLHSLRKQAKGLRYQMELFTDLYGESYTAYVAEVKSIQQILGSLQDSVVLGEWLVNVLKSDIDAKLPTLATLLAKNRYQLWQQWRPLQERYLQGETRKSLHLTILQPD